MKKFFMDMFAKGIAIWAVAIAAGGAWLYVSSDRQAKADATQAQPTSQPPVTAQSKSDNFLRAKQVKSETDALIRAAVAIRANLTDPDSANVKDVDVFHIGSYLTTVCGRVNAKNKFGGYVGFKSFIYREAAEEPYQVKIAEDDDGTWALYIKNECLKDKLEAEKKMK